MIASKAQKKMAKLIGPTLLIYRGAIFESPQMWVWPQVRFGHSPAHPHCTGGPFPQTTPLPSLPSLYLFLPPPPPGLFLQRSGRGQRGWSGGGVLGHRGVDGALGARPTPGPGGTRHFEPGSTRASIADFYPILSYVSMLIHSLL